MSGTENVEATAKIVNVVASAKLGQTVNLNAVVQSFANAEFPSKRFPGLAFRLKKPKTTSLIFRSGKIVCAGGRSEKEAIEAVEKIIKKYSKMGIIVPHRPRVKTNNMVASADLRRMVDIASFCALQGTIYEPDQFPALVYQMEDPRVFFLVFSTVRLICAGAKNKKEIHVAIRALIQKLDASLPCQSFDRADTSTKTEYLEGTHKSPFKLDDLTSSSYQGKACIYADGLWCHNESCIGPSCKFANLVQARLADGLYGCWGFYWQKEWYTTKIKKSQRKFDFN